MTHSSRNGCHRSSHLFIRYRVFSRSTILKQERQVKPAEEGCHHRDTKGTEGFLCVLCVSVVTLNFGLGGAQTAPRVNTKHAPRSGTLFLHYPQRPDAFVQVRPL